MRFFAISGNICAKNRIAVTNTSKLYQIIYSVNQYTLTCAKVSTRFYPVDAYCKTNTSCMFSNTRITETSALLRRSVASMLEVFKRPYCPIDPILHYAGCVDSMKALSCLEACSLGHS
jgi:hypothetical protein